MTTDRSRNPIPRGSSDEGQPGPEPADPVLDPGVQAVNPGAPEHDQPAEGGREEVEKSIERSEG